MIALDTNVLVRFVTADDAAQYKLAKQLISKYRGQSQSIYINVITLCELVWVLNRGYQYNRQQISEVLHMIISVEEFVFSAIEKILEAIILYKNGRGDFADYLIQTMNQYEGCSVTYSFDQVLVKEMLFKGL